MPLEGGPAGQREQAGLGYEAVPSGCQGMPVEAALQGVLPPAVLGLAQAAELLFQEQAPGVSARQPFLEPVQSQLLDEGLCLPGFLACGRQLGLQPLPVGLQLEALALRCSETLK